jgi:Asp/Glu/hydantoin racemase
MSPAIYVLNPNSSEAVTAAIECRAAGFRRPGVPQIRCETVTDGPPAIESARDMEQAVPALLRCVGRLEQKSSGFIIACFSDPGLGDIRQMTSRMVLGIGECGARRATQLGQRVGVVSILEAAIPRHRAYFERLGLQSFLAGDLPIGLGVAQILNVEYALNRVVTAARELRDRYKVDVLLLGCAAMGKFREEVERMLEIPVVDPVEAAIDAMLQRLDRCTQRQGESRRMNGI